jgi:hypothetical protein
MTELENAVELVDSQRDALYEYDGPEQQKINNDAPWKKEYVINGSTVKDISKSTLTFTLP